MSNEIMRSPAVIAGEINQLKSQTSGIIAAAMQVAGRACIEIGKRLVEAKAMVGHGEWGAWLEENVSYSVSTAENLMRIFREYGDEQVDMLTGKSPAEAFAELSYSQMTALFALPAAKRVEFVEEHKEELVGEGALSIRELQTRIKELEVKAERETKRADSAQRRAEEEAGRVGEAYRSEQAYKEMAEKAAADRDAARARVAELEAQPPQEVTVIAAEPSEEQAAAIRAKALEEAEARHREELQQLEADFGDRIEEAKAEARKEAQKEQAKLVTDQIAANNEKNKAALDKAEKEIRRLKAAANLHAQRINYALEAINRAMSDIDNEIRAAESETAGAGTRLKAQVEAALGKMVDGRGWMV